MKRHELSLFLALCIALGVHLLLLRHGIRVANRDLGVNSRLPVEPAGGDALQGTPAPLITQIPLIPEEKMGDHDGTGRSINSSPGEEPMQSIFAEQEQDQALMSRDRPGAGGKTGGASLAQVLEGENGNQGQDRGTNKASGKTHPRQSQADDLFSPRTPDPADAANPKSKAAVPPLLQHRPIVTAQKQDTRPDAPPNPTQGKSATDILPNLIAIADNLLPRPDPTSGKTNVSASLTPPAPAQTPTPPQRAADPRSAQADAGANPGNPGVAAAAGSPGPKDDFESVPVVKEAALAIVAGREIAQKGRRMKTRTLPHLSPAGWGDVISMGGAMVVLELSIDETGNVTDVHTVHASGSTSIDDPCERAAATWWFEPSIDPKTGKAVPDVIHFTIVFR